MHDPPARIFSFGTSSIPTPSIEIKLHSVPEAGYCATAASLSPPRSQILLRGPSVAPSYYRRPDLNVDPAVFTGSAPAMSVCGMRTAR